MVSDLTNPLQLRYVKVASSSPDPVFHFNPAGAGIYLCEQRSVSELKRDGLDIDFHSREILVNARLKCSSMIQPYKTVLNRLRHDDLRIAALQRDSEKKTLRNWTLLSGLNLLGSL